jgi:hypothetical protein
VRAADRGGGRRRRGALVLLAGSVENSALFSHWQPWILLLNICGVMALGAAGAQILAAVSRFSRSRSPARV